MTLRLRPEEPTDDAFLRALVMDTIAGELGADHWPEPIRSQLLGMQYNNRRSPRPDASSLVIEVDGQDAGWLLTRPTAEGIWLVEIMVSRSLQGKGIGTAVIREVLAAGKPVRLHVNVTNIVAQRLYERLGFRCAEDTGVQYLMEHP